jgi:hypothetical protein
MAAGACFLVAGATGVLFRIGTLSGLPWGLDFANVRHAHSHLMYFGWVTPALMLLIGAYLPASAPRRVATATLVLAGLAYPPFLLYGYGMASLGAVQLPLSVILATLNILAWYAFTGVYARHRTGAPARPRRFWDAAVGLLLLASMGAWGLGAVQAMRPESPFWFAAALHLFLDLFANGWLLMAVLGCAVATLEPPASAMLRWGRRLLTVGVPATFVLSIPVGLAPAGLRAVGSGGGLLAAAGLGGVLFALGRAAVSGGRDAQRHEHWWVPLASFGAVSVAWMGLSVPSVTAWALRSGLRILYLHVLLLGGVTLGLGAAARATWGRSAAPLHALLAGSVLVLLATLLPTTGLWPAAWGGPWVGPATVGGAAAPVLAALVMLGRMGVLRQGQPDAAVPRGEQ